MAGDVRQRMVEGAVVLLATQGLDKTSFSEVIERTGTPRGSIYHHFPGGKDQLIAAAVDQALASALEAVGSVPGRTPAQVAEAFLGAWRSLLTLGHFRAGCSLAAVAVATDSAELRRHAGKAFSTWQERLADLLEQSGLSRPAADRNATMLLAASEGAVIISRATGDIGPFDSVSESLLHAIRSESLQPDT